MRRTLPFLPMLLALACLSTPVRSPDPGGIDPGTDATDPDDGSGAGDDQAQPGDEAGPRDEGEAGTPDDGAGDPGGVDDGAGDPGASCPFQATLAVEGGQKHLRWGQSARVSLEVTGTGGSPAWTLEGGDGRASLEPDGTAAIVTFQGGVVAGTRTATVRVQATVAVGGCTLEPHVDLKLLGSVWVTTYEPGDVQAFRSDGEPLGTIIASTYLRSPWSLLELPDGRVLVGNRSPLLSNGTPGTVDRCPIEVYSLDPSGLGTLHESPFPVIAGGTYIWGNAGANALLLHPSDGRVWAAGPGGTLLVFETDGTYAGKIPLGSNVPAESLTALPNGDTLVTFGTSSRAGGGSGWAGEVLGPEGTSKGPFSVTGGSLDLVVNHAAMMADGTILFGGTDKEGPQGWLARVQPNGVLKATAGPFAAWIPRYGIAALGGGALVVTTDRPGEVVDAIRYVQPDLQDAPTLFTTGAEGRWRGILVLGGGR